MSSPIKQFFLAFLLTIIAFGLSAVIFVVFLMFNICAAPECPGLLVIPVPLVLLFLLIIRRWGLGWPVIGGFVFGVFLGLGVFFMLVGTSPLSSIGILAGIVFVLFWLWIFLRIILAIFQAISRFIVLIRKAPHALGVVFLFIQNYPSVVTIVAVNLMPLMGVVWYDWDPFAVLFIYWIQTGIIGYFSFLKIKKVCEYEPPERRIQVIAFTVRKSSRAQPTSKIIRDYRGVLLYGMISSLVLLIFFTGYASKKTLGWDILYYSFPAVWASISGSFLAISLGSFSFFLNHGYSYFFNFLGKKEYLNSNLEEQLTFPIERVGSIWGAIFIAITVLGFIPHLFTVIASLVFLKIMLDVYAHVKEHGKFVLPPVQGVKEHEDGNSHGDNYFVSKT